MEFRFCGINERSRVKMNLKLIKMNPYIICLLALLFAFFQNPSKCFGFEISIDVAPNTLNLQSEGSVVTVHTDIAYDDVDVSTVYLNGIAIKSWKADNRGNFVAKFSMEDVKKLDGLKIDGYNMLKIVGLTKNVQSFWGQKEIKVVDNIPQGGR